MGFLKCTKDNFGDKSMDHIEILICEYAAKHIDLAKEKDKSYAFFVDYMCKLAIYGLKKAVEELQTIDDLDNQFMQ